MALPSFVWNSATFGRIVMAFLKSASASSALLSSRNALPLLFRTNGWLESSLIAYSNASAACAGFPPPSSRSPFLFHRNTSFGSSASAASYPFSASLSLPSFSCAAALSASAGLFFGLSFSIRSQTETTASWSSISLRASFLSSRVSRSSPSISRALLKQRSASFGFFMKSDALPLSTSVSLSLCDSASISFDTSTTSG